jgi:pimeloyl-ACP methyl ester carboxylesterase
VHKQGNDVGLVFIHGAGLQGAIWKDVVEEMEAPCLQVNYPLREGTADARSNLSLMDYAACIKAQVEAWPVKRFVIVAHSIGGVVALPLAQQVEERIAGFVGIGAAIPGQGGSFLSTLQLPKRWLISFFLRKWGTVPTEAALRAGLCNDLSEQQAAEVVKGFLPEAMRLYTDRSDAPVPEVPKLYVTLTKDKQFSASQQRRMVASLSPHAVCSLDTGHLPMVSDPMGLSRLLASFVAGCK